MPIPVQSAKAMVERAMDVAQGIVLERISEGPPYLRNEVLIVTRMVLDAWLHLERGDQPDWGDAPDWAGGLFGNGHGA